MEFIKKKINNNNNEYGLSLLANQSFPLSHQLWVNRHLMGQAMGKPSPNGS